MTELANTIFNEFPRKEARGPAVKAITKALALIQKEDGLCSVDAHEWLLRKTVLYRRHINHMLATGQKEPQFIPMPATFYNQQRYRDSESWEQAPEIKHQDLYALWKEQWPAIEAEYQIRWEDPRFWGKSPEETWNNLPAAIRAELKS